LHSEMIFSAPLFSQVCGNPVNVDCMPIACTDYFWL